MADPARGVGPGAGLLEDPDDQGGCDEPREKSEFGLALSGGGYRAMLFHLGALERLNELGLLGKIGRFSSVSGGSFAAAILARAWDRLEFVNGRTEHFDREIRQPILDLAGGRVDVWLVPLGLIPPIRAARVLEMYLDRRYLHGTMLDQLPVDPIFTFNAMHFATGVGWRFSRRYMGTYRVGLICDPKVKLATAVASSAAFPPLVGPYRLSLDPASWTRTKGADLFDTAKLREEALLLDGGAYDNLGVQPLLNRCKTVLVSDGGGNLGVDTRTWRYRLWLLQLRRVLDASVDQGRDLRRHALIEAKKAGLIKVGIWRTLTDPGKFTVKQPFVVPRPWREHLATVGTRMWPPSRTDRDALVAWGYVASDLVLRSYIVRGKPAPTRIPFDFDFTAPPPGAKRAGGVTAMRNDE
jgi:NTE family protein